MKLFKHLFYYPISGLISFVKSERSFKVILIGFFISNIIGFLYQFDALEFFLINAGGFITLISELLNTAIEANVDLVTEDFHDKAKTAKDTAAAAEFVASCLWFVTVLLFMLDVV